MVVSLYAAGHERAGAGRHGAQRDGRALALLVEAPALTTAADQDPTAAVGRHVAVELLRRAERGGQQPVEAVGARRRRLLDRPARRCRGLRGQAVRRCISGRRRCAPPAATSSPVATADRAHERAGTSNRVRQLRNHHHLLPPPLPPVPLPTERELHAAAKLHAPWSSNQATRPEVFFTHRAELTGPLGRTSPHAVRQMPLPRKYMHSSSQIFNRVRPGIAPIVRYCSPDHFLQVRAAREDHCQCSERRARVCWSL